MLTSSNMFSLGLTNVKFCQHRAVTLLTCVNGYKVQTCMHIIEFSSNCLIVSRSVHHHLHLLSGTPRGSVGPRAKYLFGGPDDVIMYGGGTRVY